MKLPSALLALALLPSLAAFAADPAIKQMTLDECIQMALQKNLDIRVSRYLPEFSEIDLWGTYGAYDPTFRFEANRDVSLTAGTVDEYNRQVGGQDRSGSTFRTSLGGLLPTGASYNLSGSFNRADTERTNFVTGVTYSGNASASISQPLLKNFWIDSARLNIQLAKKALRQDQESVRLQVMTTVTDVQLAYYSLFAAREAVLVQVKALELAERSLAESKKKVEVGMLAPLDEKESESQLAAVKANLISARQNLKTASNDLKRLITDDYAGMAEMLDTVHELTPTPYPFSRQESWQEALTKRPEVVQAQLSLEQQDITLRYRKNQLFPQLDVNADYTAAGFTSRGTNAVGAFQGTGEFFRQVRDRESPSHGFGAVLSFPLSNRSERSRYKSAKLTKEQLLLQLKRLEQNIMVGVDNAILNAETAYERIEATKQAKLFAEQALDAEQKKLENGKSTYFRVLDLQNRLTAASYDAVNTVANYYRSLVQLRQAEGTTLDKAGVKLDFK